MGFLPPGYPPYLFDWIQVGRIRRKGDKRHPVTDVLVLGFFLDKPFRFLVPGCIVQDEDDPLVPTRIALVDELPEAVDGRLPVEPQRFGNEEPPVRWDAFFLPAYDFTCGLLPFGDHVRAMVLWMLKCTSSWNTMMFDSSELRVRSFF